jgi:hypothetical protein
MSENETENEANIDKIKRISRNFLYSIDEKTDLLGTNEEDSDENLISLKENLKKGIDFLDSEGFFRNNKMKNEILESLNTNLITHNKTLSKILKSVQFNFLLDFLKPVLAPYVIKLAKNLKEGKENEQI